MDYRLNDLKDNCGGMGTFFMRVFDCVKHLSSGFLYSRFMFATSLNVANTELLLFFQFVDMDFGRRMGADLDLG